MANKTPERLALEALWPFLEEEVGMCITTDYAQAIFNAAKILGKGHPVLHYQGHGMFYVSCFSEAHDG